MQRNVVMVTKTARMTISETDLMTHCTIQRTVFHDLVQQLQGESFMVMSVGNQFF